MKHRTSRGADARAAGQRARRPASWKIPFALALVFVIALLPGVYGLWAALLLPIVCGYAARSRIRLAPILRRTLMAEPFVVGASLLVLLRPNGWLLFSALVVKATACVLILQVLASETPFYETIGVLQKARVPAVLTATLSLLHRYVPVLFDELSRMRRARAARTFRGNRILAWHNLGFVIGPLFVRSTFRAERIDAAMRARGWS